MVEKQCAPQAQTFDIPPVSAKAPKISGWNTQLLAISADFQIVPLFVEAF